jgi:hypothetical protein
MRSSLGGLAQKVVWQEGRPRPHGVRRTGKLKLLDAVTFSRFALIAGEAPAFPVLTGWFQIRSTF